MLYFTIKNDELKKIHFINEDSYWQPEIKIHFNENNKINYVSYDEKLYANKDYKPKDNSCEALMILKEPKKHIRQALKLLNKELDEMFIEEKYERTSKLKVKFLAISHFVSELKEMAKYT